MALAVVRSAADQVADEKLAASGGGFQSLMIDEVFAHATEDQALSFFVAVGTRLATANPLPENDAVSGLEQAINEVWSKFGFGRVALAITSDGIAIDHQDYCGAEAAQSPSWPGAAQALLRGAYGTWFLSIGGAAKLHMRPVLQTAERIQLHYGL
jgi:hypothetical protein